MQIAILTVLLFAGLYTTALPELQISGHGSKNPPVVSTRRSLRRARTVDTGLAEILTLGIGGGYFTTVMVGTPPQPQQMLLDTGSGDTYVLTSSSCTAAASEASSCRGGVFYPDDSTTYSVIEPSPAFNITYGDGSSVVGPYSKDTMIIGDIAIENVEFAVAEADNATVGHSTGILGLDYSDNEVSNKQYPNLPEVLRDAGVINSRLFSVYLNEFSSSGSVLFGGIDSSRYSGELVTLDLIPYPDQDQVTDFVTTITALAVSVGSSGLQQTIFSGGAPVNEVSQRNDSALPVLLCIGCVDFEVPQAYYDQLINSSFTFIDTQRRCSCDHRNDDHVLQIIFGAQTAINVPARDFIVPIYNDTGAPIAYGDNSDACYFMISPVPPQSNYTYILGEAMLRSMHLVFDLDNAQVSIAQAVINSTASPDVQTVPAGPNGVQGAAERVQPAASNTYSIPTAASFQSSYSTFAAPTLSQSTSSGVVASTATNASPTSSASKGAAVVSISRTICQSRAWTSIVLAIVAAFTTGTMM